MSAGPQPSAPARVVLRPRILVTGLSGLVGSRLAAVAGEGFDLAGLDLDCGVDIADERALAEALDRCPEANALVHLAAFTDVSAAHAQRGDKKGACHRVNVLGTQNVARACARRGLHLIHVSTDFVFDGKKSSAYTELDAPSPIEWYGQTKLAAEKIARETPSWTILRIAFPYSAGPAPRADFARKIHDRLAAGEEASLFADQVMTPTFADDVALGILLVARLRPHGEVFHLCGSSSLTPFDLGLKIARLFRFDERLVRASSLDDHLKIDPRPRQRRLQMSNAKWSGFAARHGLAAPLTVDEGLARARQLDYWAKSFRSKAE